MKAWLSGKAHGIMDVLTGLKEPSGVRISRTLSDGIGHLSGLTFQNALSVHQGQRSVSWKRVSAISG